MRRIKGGWRIAGGAQAQKNEAKARFEIIADTFLSMNAPVQLALPAFLSQGPAFQKQLMERVRQNLAELDRQLSRQKVCNRLEVEGGWYVVLRVPATHSDEELALLLLEERGVYVHPGHFYDFPQDGFLVVSLITPERDFTLGLAAVLSRFD